MGPGSGLPKKTWIWIRIHKTAGKLILCVRERETLLNVFIRNPDPGIGFPLPDLPVAAETLVDGLDVLRQVGPFHRQAKKRRPYNAIRSESFLVPVL